jgi:small GTP-binding protein
MMTPDTGRSTSVKIVVVGESGVGKSQILRRFARDEFQLDTRATIGVEFASKQVQVDGISHKLQVWDTAGQERYRALTASYYRNAGGCLLVFDLTKRQTFAALSRWIAEIRQHTDGASVRILLVGNKADLVHIRQIPACEAKKFAQDNDLDFVETSALDGSNIHLAFTKILGEVLRASPLHSPVLVSSLKIAGDAKAVRIQRKLRCCR